MTLFSKVLPVLLLLAVPAAADDRVVASVAGCVPAPQALIDQHARDWQGWAGTIDLCAIRSPGGAHALDLLAARYDRYESERWTGVLVPLGRYPDLLVLDRGGAVLVRLPVSFPSDYPGRTVLVFSDWRSGFPWRIDARRINAAALGTFDLKPRIWNPSLKRYEVGAGVPE